MAASASASPGQDPGSAGSEAAPEAAGTRVEAGVLEVTEADAAKLGWDKDQRAVAAESMQDNAFVPITRRENANNALPVYDRGKFEPDHLLLLEFAIAKLLHERWMFAPTEELRAALTCYRKSALAAEPRHGVACALGCQIATPESQDPRRGVRMPTAAPGEGKDRLPSTARPWRVQALLEGRSWELWLEGSHLCGQGHAGCVREDHVVPETHQLNVDRQKCHQQALCEMCGTYGPVRRCPGHEGSSLQCVQTRLLPWDPRLAEILAAAGDASGAASSSGLLARAERGGPAPGPAGGLAEGDEEELRITSQDGLEMLRDLGDFAGIVRDCPEGVAVRATLEFVRKWRRQ